MSRSRQKNSGKHSYNYGQWFRVQKYVVCNGGLPGHGEYSHGQEWNTAWANETYDFNFWISSSQNAWIKYQWMCQIAFNALVKLLILTILIMDLQRMEESKTFKCRPLFYIILMWNMKVSVFTSSLSIRIYSLLCAIAPNIFFI